MSRYGEEFEEINELDKIGETLLAYNYSLNNEENAGRMIDKDYDDETVIIKVGDLVCVDNEEGVHLAITNGNESFTVVMTGQYDNSYIGDKIRNYWKAKGYSIEGADERSFRPIYDNTRDELLNHISEEFINDAFRYNDFIINKYTNNTENKYTDMENIEERFIKRISDLINNEAPITKSIAFHISNRIIENWTKIATLPIGTRLENIKTVDNIPVYSGDLFFINGEYRVLVGCDYDEKYFFTTEKTTDCAGINKYVTPEASNYLKIDKLKQKPLQYNVSWLAKHKHYMQMILNYLDNINNEWEIEVEKLIPYCYKNDIRNGLAKHIGYQILDGFNSDINETNDIGYTTNGEMIIINTLFGTYYKNDKINTINLDNLCTDIQGTYLYSIAKNKLKNGDIVYIQGTYAFYYNGKYMILNSKKELKEVKDNSKKFLVQKALNLIDVIDDKINVDFIINNGDKTSDIVKNIINLSIQNKINKKE